MRRAFAENRIEFSSVSPRLGEHVRAKSRYIESEEEDGAEKRAAFFIGPEFRTVARFDLFAPAHEAAEVGYTALVPCVFNFETRSLDVVRPGRVPVVMAQADAGLRTADYFRNDGKGNPAVLFGELNIERLPVEDDGSGIDRFQFGIIGDDVFDPTSGEMRSDDENEIAC